MKLTMTEFYDNLITKIAQLDSFVKDGKYEVPKSIDITALVSAMSAFNAIKQMKARTSGIPIDQLVLKTQVTKWKEPQEVVAAADEGYYIHGFHIEGASWDINKGHLVEVTPNQMSTKMPVIHVTAVEKN